MAPTAGEVAGAMAATPESWRSGDGWVGWGTRRRRSLRPGPRHGLGAGEHALPASAGQRGRGRAGRPVRQQHERRHAAPALHAAHRQQLGSPASSRASSQSGFRVQAQTNHTPRPFFWGLNPVTLPQSQPNSRQAPAARGSRARAACLHRATTSWPETSRRPRLSFAVRAKMSVALHVKKHGGSHSRSAG